MVIGVEEALNGGGGVELGAPCGLRSSCALIASFSPMVGVRKEALSVLLPRNDGDTLLAKAEGLYGSLGSLVVRDNEWIDSRDPWMTAGKR